MRVGERTFLYDRPPRVAAHASIVGPKESEGPLAAWFDEVSRDDLFGQKTWEMGESEMLRRCVARAMTDADVVPEDAQALFSGDLNDQIIATGFAARALGVPLVGLYGACSTFVEGLVLAAALVSGGYLQNALCAASSHFCTAERQFRFPLEMGTQRPPSAQWTATAAGCALLAAEEGPGLRVTAGTLGRIVDRKIKDANHMGAAMAPAVEATILAHLDDTGAAADDFDLIATGDLGWIGREILLRLLRERGRPLPPEKLVDCGASLGEAEMGAGKGLGSLVYYTIGTGLGGGFYYRGTLLHGLVHPEMGHMLMRPHPKDPAPHGFCPFHDGCLEGMACGKAMQQRWGVPAHELPPDHIAWEIEAEYLAQMCANTTVILSPERIVLGGGVMHQEHLFPMVRKRTLELLNNYVSHPAILEHIDTYIVPPGLGNNSGAVGSLLLAVRALG